MEAVIEYNETKHLSFLDKLKFLSNFISKVVLYVLFLILILIFAVVVVYFFDLFYNLKTGKNTPPLFNAYVIVSPSMVPNINVNDAIVVKREEEENLKKGDIITFSSNDGRYQGLTITHRIVGIQVSQNGEKLYRTKGDANNVEDSALVKYDDIYGKVMMKIPKLGYIQSLLVNSYGWLFLIVVPCVSVIVYDIVKMARGFKKSKNLENEEEISENKKEEINKVANDSILIEEQSKVEVPIEVVIQQDLVPNVGVEEVSEVVSPIEMSPNVGVEEVREVVSPIEMSPNVGAEEVKEVVSPIEMSPNVGVEEVREVVSPIEMSPNLGAEEEKEVVTSIEMSPNVGVEEVKEIVPPIEINPNDIVEVPIVENTVSTAVISQSENINTAVEEDEEII